MFIIATSGRCGTEAICEGLNRFSDHEVRHEPEPSLLEEAWAKHQGRNHKSLAFYKRMLGFSARGRTKYGETFRAPNLLTDIRAFARKARILVVVRSPVEYVMSAHYKKVMSKGTRWDRLRLLPLEQIDDQPLAEKIALHWVTVNDYLLDFVENDGKARIVLYQPWNDLIPQFPDLLGVKVENEEGLRASLDNRQNASKTHEIPDGFNLDKIENLCQSTWKRAQQLAVEVKR